MGAIAQAVVEAVRAPKHSEPGNPKMSRNIVIACKDMNTGWGKVHAGDFGTWIAGDKIRWDAKGIVNGCLHWRWADEEDLDGDARQKKKKRKINAESQVSDTQRRNQKPFC